MDQKDDMHEQRWRIRDGEDGMQAVGLGKWACPGLVSFRASVPSSSEEIWSVREVLYMYLQKVQDGEVGAERTGLAEETTSKALDRKSRRRWLAIGWFDIELINHWNRSKPHQGKR